MKYMKNFEGFINENSRINEGGENELQAQKEIVAVLQKAPEAEVAKVMQSAKDLADQHGIDVAELSDPRVALELLLKNAAESGLTEGLSLDEGFSDWWKNTKIGLKKLAIKVGLYGGLAGVISALAGAAAAGTMAGYDPTSPGYKASTWPWFQEMCHTIYPQPDSMSNTDYRGTVASVLILAMFISAGVMMASLQAKGNMDDKKYGAF
jgi:hypothetical protein